MKRCRTCRKQHHTTLHAPASYQDTATVASSAASPSTAQVTSHVSVLQGGTTSTQINAEKGQGIQPSSNIAQSRVDDHDPGLLATAVVNVLSRSKQFFKFCALLDQGSEVSFISESAAQFLKLPRRAKAIPILGIGAQKHNVSNGLAFFTIVSRIDSASSHDIKALVLPRLTASQPLVQLDATRWPHLNGLQLADPNFETPSKIDLILGLSVYARIIRTGRRHGHIDAPIAQNTALGWILVSGSLSNENLAVSAAHSSSVIGTQCSFDSELLELLQRFWTQGEIVPRSQVSLTPEKSKCEAHFEMTHSCDIQGRFVVRLPFRTQTF